jgi:hypothetical protein
MNSDEIRNRREVIQTMIKACQDELKDLQQVCTHENVNTCN